MHSLHSGTWEHAHRMLNAITPSSYSRPHRHLDPYKSEGFIILRGKVAVVVFDASGNIDFDETTVLEAGGPTKGVDIPPGTWHCVVAFQDSVMYEVKGQPNEGYDRDLDKEFAQWAPEEEAEGAEAYLREIETRIAADT